MTIHVSNFNHCIILHSSFGKTLGVNHSHFDADYLQQKMLVTDTAQGRGTVYFFAVGNTKLVLRHYKRGGLVAKINDDKFIFTGIKNSRCFKELHVLQQLREHEVNVPQPIAGRIVKSGLFYTADIITELINDAIELHERLQKKTVAIDIWKAVGGEIRKMHDAQVCHYDLNVKNILLAKQEGNNTVHLLDFDKCELKTGNSWKPANLDRLQRSLVKQANTQLKYHYLQDDWKSLMAGYRQNSVKKRIVL